MDDSEGEQLPNGLVPDHAASYAASFAKSISVDNERWAKAELRTAEIIDKIQPTRASEERRKDIAQYVRVLISQCFPCEVFTFGSVPLLTYLPDGDIDLTIVSQDPTMKDTWANIVRSMLERAEHNQDGKFLVREVQYIHAEVKLIKCLVENIIVDISFNQLGGLCTLCFLDEVDLLIGQNHFFKRSIILVKAWCYYESMILGAHHGLISTYALETLVLYIFHVFHNSIRGPLEVLLRFLEFFSKFDWHKYCVSLRGPVPIASLPEMAAESPRKDGGDLRLSTAFLSACGEAYAVFPAGQDNQQRTFNAKYLNVVDPLHPGNNLGRSVNQTSFNRIIGVFGHSADKLLKILLDSSKDIVEQLEDKKRGFFKRIRKRLDKLEEKRPDAPDFTSRRIPNSAGSNNQNGYVPIVMMPQENGDSLRSYGAETYYVDQRFQNKSPGWVSTSDFDPRTQTSTRVAHIGGSQAHIASSALSHAGGESNYGKGTSPDSFQDNGVSSAPRSNGSSSTFESSYSTHAGGNGIQPNTEALEKPKGHSRRTSLDLLHGEMPENTVNGSRQLGDARDLASHDVHSSDPADVKATGEEYASKGAVPGGSRVKHPGSNFGSNHASPTASTQVTAPEYLRVNGHFAADDSSEGSTPSRGNANSGSDREASRRGGWALDQSSYRETGGGVDGQVHTQHRVQDANSRGQSIPLSLSLLPTFVQIPSLTLSHPMHLTTSMAMASTMGHPSLTLSAPPLPPLGLHSGHPSSVLGDSSLGPRAGPYYGIRLPRGPPAPPLPPPLPPGYYHGPFQQSSGENSNTISSRMSAYPAQHVDEKSFDQQQRNVWQQVEQMQVHDHHHQYGVQRPGSTGGTSTSSLSQHTDSDSSANTAVSRTQTPLEPRVSKSGSSSNLENSSDSTAGHELLDDLPIEENGKPWHEDTDIRSSVPTRGKVTALSGSEGGSKGNKNSKSSREKRGLSKNKISSSEESAETVKSVDGLSNPNSNSESVVRWPAQGASEDSVTVTQGYSQVVHSLASIVYHPNWLPSSLPLPGNGSMTAELSPYPPPPLLPSNRTTVAHSTLPTQSQAQTSATSVIYPVGTSSSFRPPVTEPVSGSVTPGSNQRQRPMETTSMHPPPYYSAANLYSPYMSAFPVYYQMSSDSLNAYPFSSTVENFNNESNAAQAADNFRSKGAQQIGQGVGERLKAVGVPIRAGFSKMELTTDSRSFDGSDSKDTGHDLLSSDFNDHWRNLVIARSYQRVLAYQHSYPTLSKHYSNFRPWEVPGRPLPPNMNMLTNMMNHGHGLVPGPPSVNASGRMVGNYPRTYGPVTYGGDEQPKLRGGTGTYLPTPRPGFFRDRQSSGNNRNQHGGYCQDRSERSDREGHQGHNQRYRGMGRGQSKYEPRSQSNSMGDRNNVDVKGGERGRDGQRLQDGLRRNPVQSAPNATFASPSPGQSTVSVLSATSVGLPAAMYSVPVVPSNGKSSTPGMAGAPVPPTVMVYPSENEVGFGGEPLEFGSLGPVHAGTTQGASGVDHGAAHTPSPSGSTALSLASDDRSSQGPSSPKQRVMQRTYQLKEEDFPPLSFRGQHGSSSTGYNSGSSASSPVSPFPAYVATPSS